MSRIPDPLALSSSAATRLLLAGGVGVVMWAAVTWAMAS